MKLIPKIADSEVAPGSIKIYVDKAALDGAHAIVTRSQSITQVTKETVINAVTVGKELHKLIGQIEASRKAAKRQFLDANTAIDELAKKVCAPVIQQYNRVMDLLAGWNKAEELRKASEEKAQREAEARLQAELDREAAEREKERQALLAAQANATTREQLEQASMDLEFHESEIPVDLGDQLEAIEIPINTAPQAPIPGAVTTTRWKYKLLDPVAAYRYDKYLVRWALSIQQCNDIVRMLQDKGLEIKIPGVEITQETNVTTPSGRQ